MRIRLCCCGVSRVCLPEILFSLLEKPENHHMIRWDANGDHLIVERPEQLALHVLPSVYRQSRFASFSRQLNVSVLPPPLPFHLVYAIRNPLSIIIHLSRLVLSRSDD